MEEANEETRWQYVREREIESTMCGEWRQRCAREAANCGENVREMATDTMPETKVSGEAGNGRLIAGTIVQRTNKEWKQHVGVYEKWE
mgnify:CR=1 FL=1